MATARKKKIARKTKKTIVMVAVESELFDAPVELPSLKRVPLGALHAADRGNLGPMFAFIQEYAPKESAEAFMDLDGTEMLDFMKAWSVAAEVPTSGD